MKSNPVPTVKVSVAQPSTTKPKEFKWMGFKSHMMATMAKWREIDYLTDTTFHCHDGQKVSAHRLVLAAASPLLKEAMSQDLCDQVVIIVPEVTSIVMTAILDLVYKGRMNITPTSTWAIRSLVEILKINAEDVSVISAGAKKLTPATPAITLRVPVPSPKSPAAAVQPPQTSVTPQPQNNGAAPELVVSSRGRKRKQTVSPPKIPAKVARVSTPGTTPKATSKKQQLAEKKTIASTKKQQSVNKKSVKNNNPSSKSSIAAAALADADDPLNTSTGYHDLEDVETWVCGVCKCYDPIITTPVKNPKQAEAMMTTEWIGCDCNRWYHKYCTKLKKIDDSFSCVQLGIECLPLS